MAKYSGSLSSKSEAIMVALNRGWTLYDTLRIRTDARSYTLEMRLPVTVRLPLSENEIFIRTPIYKKDWFMLKRVGQTIEMMERQGWLVPDRRASLGGRRYWRMTGTSIGLAQHLWETSYNFLASSYTDREKGLLMDTWFLERLI